MIHEVILLARLRLFVPTMPPPLTLLLAAILLANYSTSGLPPSSWPIDQRWIYYEVDIIIARCEAAGFTTFVNKIIA